MKPDTQQTYRERMLKVLVYIQNHLDEAMTLDELARVAYFSPYHFHRIFRGMVGESVMEHIRRLRLERAAHRLKFSDLPVTRIAFEAGYETHEAFTRAFRALFAESPSQFRDTHQALPFPKAPSQVHYDPSGDVAEQHLAKRASALAVRVEAVKPMRLAFMRHTGPYADVGGTWMRLLTWAGMKGLMGPQYVILGIVHDDPDVTPPEKVRYDACIVVDDRVRPEGEVGIQQIEGGLYGITTHRGPYDRLGETYLRLCGEWLPANRYETRSAPCFELYRNSPHNTAAQDLLTDIHLPLAD
jgi:AraC family transcriptional regulator